MTTEKSKKLSRRMPDFASYEEEATFWDTHSPLDFPDDFEEVEMTVSRPVEIVHVKDWRESLVAALTKLSEAERQVLALNVLGLYPNEIAQVMGCSTAETQKVLRAAKRRTKLVA